MTREEVVQAALTVERWCKEHYGGCKPCDCPFMSGDYGCIFYDMCDPWLWELEEFLRTRGLKDD
jgi:hypothetical protein